MSHQAATPIMTASLPVASRTKFAIRNLAPFSAIAVRMLLLLRRPNVSYRDVMELLKKDAAFSAEVLRLANSAALGSRFQTESILQALTMVGIPRVSALTATLALNKFLRPVSRLPIQRDCWRHNLATAFAASELAGKYNLDPDYAYTFGLLHEIGRMVLLVANPGEYVSIVDVAVSENRDLAVLEQSTFGIDYREAGAWITLQWNLPSELAEVSRKNCLKGDGPVTPLCRLIDESCHIADSIGFSIGARLIPRPAASAQETPDALEFDVMERVNRFEQEYASIYQ
jgi:HD-like signal output (HDOD) protein